MCLCSVYTHAYNSTWDVYMQVCLGGMCTCACNITHHVCRHKASYNMHACAHVWRVPRHVTCSIGTCTYVSTHVTSCDIHAWCAHMTNIHKCMRGRLLTCLHMFCDTQTKPSRYLISYLAFLIHQQLFFFFTNGSWESLHTHMCRPAPGFVIFPFYPSAHLTSSLWGDV